jgi:hypothetical protein
MALVDCVWFCRGLSAIEVLQAHRPTHNSGVWDQMPRVMAECLWNLRG